MIKQTYPQGWVIRQKSKQRFYIEHDDVVLATANSLREARGIVKQLLTH